METCSGVRRNYTPLLKQVLAEVWLLAPRTEPEAVTSELLSFCFNDLFRFKLFSAVGWRAL